MNIVTKKHLSRFTLMMALSLALFGLMAAKTKSGLIKEEEGFYYGYGKAATNKEALALAKKDLIERALTATLRQSNPKAAAIEVSKESAQSRLTALKPIYPNSKDLLNAVYRISVKDWEKESKAFDENLRKSLASRYNILNARGGAIADKIQIATDLLNEIAVNGVTELLTFSADAPELFSRKIESICGGLVENLGFAISVKNGIVSPDEIFTVKVTDVVSGVAVSGLAVKTVWAVEDVLSTSTEDIQEIVNVVKTDNAGVINIDYPKAKEYQNKIVSLTVSTSFSMSETATVQMRKLDATCASEGRYVCYENVNEQFKTVAVAGGDYKTGALPHDKRASLKEIEREVTLNSFEIMAAPVTNILFAAFVYTTESETIPEYFENYEYNQNEQPVVGVKVSDAELFAAWLSEELGETFRLPTDDEWEVAARAGQEVIYPWGDEAPNKSKAANFKGNGKFKGTSAVGSFANGNNAWGLVDMSGNVWEWTSTTRGEDETLRTVKGGSWMDGPLDLRISNFKNIDPEVAGPDIGFRLVKEVVNEE